MFDVVLSSGKFSFLVGGSCVVMVCVLSPQNVLTSLSSGEESFSFSSLKWNAFFEKTTRFACISKYTGRLSVLSVALQKFIIVCVLGRGCDCVN